MIPTPYDRFIEDIKPFVDNKRIFTDPLRTFAYGTDASFYRFVPKVVVRALNEKEVRDVIAVANRYGLPVTFRAAGTSLSGRHRPIPYSYWPGKAGKSTKCWKKAAPYVLKPV